MKLTHCGSHESPGHPHTQVCRLAPDHAGPHHEVDEWPDESFVDVVFDGPPDHESGRFVECETPDGRSVNAGEWIDRGDGMWALRIPIGARS